MTAITPKAGDHTGQFWLAQLTRSSPPEDAGPIDRKKIKIKRNPEQAQNGPVFQIEIDGEWVSPGWRGLAVMTATALDTASRGPGLLTFDTWKPDWKRLELDWFALLKKVVDKHLKAHFWDADKPITPDISSALVVSQRLKEILLCGYVTEEQARSLPIEITAIERSASATNTIKAKSTRSRTNELKDAVLEEFGKEPKDRTYEQILDALQADGTVKSWDRTKGVEWFDSEDITHNKSVKTIEGWLTEARKNLK